MGFRNLCNILRFFSIPHSCCSTFLFSHFFSNTLPSTTPFFTLFHSPSSLLFSIGCSSFHSPKHPFASSSTKYSDFDYGYSCLKLGLQLHTRRSFCSYPYSSYKGRPYATSKQVSEIIALIREGVNDLGSKLDRMNVSLSMASIFEIFHKLASERVSALLFFDWLKGSHPELCCDPDIGGLVVNNCGLLGDYEAMVPILTEFNHKGMHLKRNAFGFLMVLGFDKASSMECVRKIMDVLNEVGGVCQSSGVQLLIEMFSVQGSFEIAEFFIGTDRRKVNHYNVLMRTMCKRGDYERAVDLVKEMKRSGCEPNRTTYNLLVSCLCKSGKFDEACQVLEIMEKDYGLPDASTFDILVNLLCKQRQFGLALKFLDKMTLKGIEPCISTHAVVIKSYFESGEYEEAHKYVVDSAVKQSYSSNANYSLLATLHLKKGNVLLAQNILHEMMDKGLKPNFSVFMKIRKRLEKKNKKDLSLELLRREVRQMIFASPIFSWYSAYGVYFFPRTSSL
ncbi:pentatricopeptide repeat-containing protein At1g09900-like [Gastrolobium bilobum]|uniref:pentatricopeptide repeat-containing protein At1g09900-like n=1 Tax=Gastrolobium bilobum TaxID=150636 RepID=UPI002AAF87DE|nr:pentatricopeptide repeat-containing protein At1g09900-like [Gastrolobium bilobum]